MQSDLPPDAPSADSDLVSRRSLLQFGGLAGGAFFTGALGTGALGSVLAPRASGQVTLRRPTPRPDAHIRLRAYAGQMPIYGGPRTNVWRYEGEVLSGPAHHLETIPGSYLGPTLRMHKGQRIAVDFENDLAEDTIIHWHGIEAPEDMDGHPLFAVGPGASYRYQFPIVNRAGTYWYHPHPNMRTGAQVAAGMAGLFIVSDDEEAALELPRGEHDIPLVIQDRRFNGNQFEYVADTVAGFLGDTILVNGKPNFVLEAQRRQYRLRLVNGSNSRVYKLGWSDGTPMTVIGSDGGLLAAPVQKPYVMLAPAERVEIWADFTGYSPGASFALRSLPYTASGPSGGQVPNGTQMDILQVEIGNGSPASLVLPSQLTTIVPYQANQAVNFGNPRVLPITIGSGMWLVNGGAFQMTYVAPNEYIQRGDLEIWTFTNTAGASQMIHPMHIHGAQFQVYSRQISVAGATNYETVRYGYVDEGWKDTVLVMPGETVNICVKFTNYTGLFLYHCHNLEHEDMGMMRNFQILP